ncbi:MAG: carbon-nitrogen hydrolase family protein [Lachnospiraceae bacterium]|nr:carbon-nitrogen hydrolase family protein [Lachnospiraceae bacterium]
MKISMIQMKVQKENDANMQSACRQIAAAAQAGADLVLLPEMFCCPYETANFPIYAQPQGGTNWNALSACAKENQVYLVAGSMPEREGEAVFNTCYAFDRQGKQLAKYRKMHLFDVDIKGGQRFFESETLSAGENLAFFDTEFGRIGLMICFDIRFPELARLLALQGAKAILVPAAFNMTTGPAHWELHFRSRAVDNQVFLMGCSPARDPGASYHAYGHSLAVSPWGEILAELDEQEGILSCDIDLSKTEEIREQLPLLKARRTDVYHISLI